MDKFKVGDEVQIHTNSQCGHKVGTVGKIENKHTKYNDVWYVRFENKVYGHSEEYLKLVKEVNLISNIQIW